MKNFDAELAAELQKDILSMFFMIEFVLTSGTYRYNDIDIDIYDDSGNKFTSRSFSFDNLAGSSSLSVDNLDVDIDDTDQAFSALVLGEDVRNKEVILYLGVVANQNVTGTTWDTGTVWDTGTAWMPGYTQKKIITQELSRYIIGGWELNGDNGCRITLTNELILWNKKTLRVQSASCQWLFKGTECTYAGAETWCDQSYERCKNLGNQINFPGHRFLPALMEREIWWGRSAGYNE
jgi:hypothetical protein